MVLHHVMALWIVAGAPDAGTPLGETGIAAPLGSIGRSVTVYPEGGVPGDEHVVRVRFPECGGDQALWLSQFAYGTAEAGDKIWAWLQAEKLEKKLFPRGQPLLEAIKGLRRSAVLPGKGCVPLNDSRMTSLRVNQACSQVESNGDRAGLAWFGETLSGVRKMRAVVHYAAPDTGSPTPCRPKMSAVLFDDSGKARLRYHVDFGKDGYAELLGDGCQTLEFWADARSHFRAHLLRAGHGCRK